MGHSLRIVWILFFALSLWSTRATAQPEPEEVGYEGTAMWIGGYLETAGLYEEDYQAGNLFARLPTSIARTEGADPEDPSDDVLWYQVMQGSHPDVFFRYDFVGCDGASWAAGQAPLTVADQNTSGMFSTLIEGLAVSGSYQGYGEFMPAFETNVNGTTVVREEFIGSWVTDGLPIKTCEPGTEDEWEYSVGPTGRWTLAPALMQPGDGPVPPPGETIIVPGNAVSIEIHFGGM